MLANEAPVKINEAPKRASEGLASANEAPTRVSEAPTWANEAPTSPSEPSDDHLGTSDERFRPYASSTFRYLKRILINEVRKL